ncbi:MAG: hypothetical protein KAR40_01875 [Candidatus Sabulitectum sp.]|nr:hypothetical protein [Candidatus Sabulitectum sp.]
MSLRFSALLLHKTTLFLPSGEREWLTVFRKRPRRKESRYEACFWYEQT